VSDDQYFHRFTCVDAVEKTAQGLSAGLHGERLRVDVVRADVVRFAISRGGVFDEHPSQAVSADLTAVEVPFTVEETIDGNGGRVMRLRTSELVVTLGLMPFRLDVHRPDGSPVVVGLADRAGGTGAYATLNDAFVVRRRCRGADAIYGLGEKTGRLNRWGRDFALWNVDVLDPRAAGEFAAARVERDPRGDPTSTEFDPYYVSIPFFYHLDAASGAMAGSFVDNPCRARYDFSVSGEYSIRFDGGQYVEYVFAGPRMPDILAAYTWLTGRIAIPPVWSLGYQQCRWFAYSQADVETLARRHRQEEIPCDGLWLDIEHMDGYRVFTWDPVRFPDPTAMLDRLAEAGYRLVTIVDPGIKHEPGYRVFDEAVEADLLCRTEGGGVFVGQVWPGDTAFPDFTLPETRTWWAQLTAEQVRSGVSGIWNDMNEPATGAIDPQAMRFDRGRYSHERFHNQYALLMAMATVEGMRAASPDRRPFVLSRAGSPGIQRYAANWMGDNLSRWDHLAMSMPMAAGLGLSGQAFVGADVGGFMGDANAELFLRWMQYGVLTPFCRNHSAIEHVDQYAWSFGPVVANLVREAVRLRYRLIPYLYAAFVAASRTGAPVQRPLVFDHQDDPLARDLDDEYLFGPDLLVAPVVAAGVTERRVYLPAGTWVDWYDGSVRTGPGFVTAVAPMERIPLYARGGAVIPMWPQAPDHADGYQPRSTELQVVVPAGDGTHTSLLVEDDGATTAAEGGAFRRTVFTLIRAGRTVAVQARTSGDGYPEFVRDEFVLVICGAHPNEVRIDGVDHRVTDARVRFINHGSDFDATFTV
jgi:alpha-glucosidase